MKRLTYEDRQAIEKMVAEGISYDEMASVCGVNRATIFRELDKGNTDEINSVGRYVYSAEQGQRKYELNKRAKKPRRWAI